MEGHVEMGERRASLDNIVKGRHGEDETDSRSVDDNIGGGASGEEPDSPRDEISNRRKYSRHNANQIQELEVFFKENPHPDEKARLELGTKLSMDSKKSQLKRHEIGKLKEENDKLRIEHIALKEAMKNPICDRCNSQAIIKDINIDEYQTKIEHDRLKNEIKRINVLAKKILGPSVSLEGSMASLMENSDLGFASEKNDFGSINIVDTASPLEFDFQNNLSNSLSVISPRPTVSLANEDVTYDKSKLMNLALAAMNELLRLAEIGEPLWVRSMDGGGETLNLDEYARSFTQFIGKRPVHFTTEATRAFGTVITNSVTLAETLMNKSRWMEMFPGIVGKTSTIDVISNEIGGSRSGTLLLIQTELQIICDLIPVREVKFLRFCQQYVEDIWAIVDVSIDTIQEGSLQCDIGNCRRLPSGCIVKDMPNGYSKVTWIEHMEYNETFVHQLCRPLVRTGLGFGAQRWISTLQRQSEFLTVMMSSLDPTVCSSGQRNIAMLAQRMTHNFCAMVCATIYNWEKIQSANGEYARLMMRKNIADPGEPIGVVLSATKTIWLPVKQQPLFEFFMNEQMRSHWDVLSNNGVMQPTVHISKGQNFGNIISLFSANGDDSNANQNSQLILKDAFTDSTGSLLVYALVDSLAMNVMMNGGNSSSVSVLPYGIAIVPDCYQDYSGKDFCSGSLVTIGIQKIVNNSPVAKFSAKSEKLLNDLISRTINGIKTAFKCK
ncbi:hypothetical protein RND71_005729 [Anisodus tanguticus]|uniref:START domain-containing protein n=1 Tax=Anisodus tanguticus TaxID=243964 RepID=A0AAE1VMZ8_9SOLA|nr:hypothetical protein RND71_005729 [Anisodus tanguticus]